MQPVRNCLGHHIEAGRTRRWARLLAGLVLILTASACEPALEEATYARVSTAQAKWAANPTPNYRILVEVERLGETRRYDIGVRHGEVTHASLEEWNSQLGNWSDPIRLHAEQASPFTVSGLFELVLAELRVDARTEILLAIEGDPAFPRRIALGPVLQDGRPLEGTQSTIRVRSFEILGSMDAP